MSISAESARRPVPRRNLGIGLLAIIALLSLILTIWNYVDTGNGIHGTEGALLVVGSTALLLIGSALIGMGWLRGGWHVLFDILLLLDLLGTGVAGYMLESLTLAGLMVVGLIAWLVHVFSSRTRPAVLRTEMAR